MSSFKEKEMLEKILFSNVMSQSSTLLFSIEQWELTRRLRNSGITKEQLCQAFDDLDKMDQDLGMLYNIPIPNSTNNMNHLNDNQNQSQLHNQQQLHHNSLVKNIQNFQILLNKSNSGVNGANNNATNDCVVSSSNATTIVNNHFANIVDPDIENKQIEDFRSKGEISIHSEISFFVYKHDLKQSQIARMAGVNQAYVSKFLRGEFFDLSENGKTLIYKWYLRFMKSPSIYLQAHNITLTGSSNLPNINNHPTTLNGQLKLQPPQMTATTSAAASSSFTNVTNTSYDTPKRTRFSFKPEHLVILEKSFLDNQYPDQKKREDLARMCNDARCCSEREKVSEQIITHWFQNKRKMTRKTTTDESSSKSPQSKSVNGILTSVEYTTQSPNTLNSNNNYQEDYFNEYKQIMNSQSNNSNEDDDEDEDEEDNGVY